MYVLSAVKNNTQITQTIGPSPKTQNSPGPDENAGVESKVQSRAEVPHGFSRPSEIWKLACNLQAVLC